MSSETRRIPGERLTARVLRRGTVRPSLGTPAAFYERFGLADPLAERGFVGEEALNSDDGLYSFLSAQPYYAALRAQASWRSSRARRRLLGRIAAQSVSFGSGATRRRAAPDTAGGRRFLVGSTLATDSMLTTLERPVSREELMQELEAEGWTPAGHRRRREDPARRLPLRNRRLMPGTEALLGTVETAAPITRHATQRVRHRSVGLDDGERVAVVKQVDESVGGGWTPAARRRREAPTRRLRRNSGRLAPSVQAIFETIEAAAPTARRTIRRIRQQLVDLDEGEQVVVVKQLAKRVRGPLRRLAAVDSCEVSESLDARPVAVAAERGNARATRRKGLRPVLHGSPTLKTLMFEPDTPAELEVQRRLRAVTTPRPAASRRRTSNASASRDVRQQVAAGRAGPPSVSGLPKSALPKSALPTSALPKSALPKSAPSMSVPIKSAPTRSAPPKSAPNLSAPTLSGLPKSAPPKSAPSKSASPKAAPTVSAEVPRTHRVQPMVRAARRSRAASIETILPTARGVQVVEASTVREQAAQTRVVRRATVADINGSLTASPTAYVDTPSSMRGLRRRTPTTRLNASLFSSVMAAPLDAPSIPGMSPALSSQTQPARRRRIVQTANGFQYAQPGVSSSAPVDGNTDPVLVPATSVRSRPAPTAMNGLPAAAAVVSRPTVRAVRRLRGVVRPSVAAGPVVGDASAPIARYAAAFEAPSRTPSGGRRVDLPARKRRVHLASSPMDFVQISHQAEASADNPVPLARASRPTSRAHERAERLARVDERDVALQMASPVRYVQQRTVAGEQPLSKSPVVRKNRNMAAGSVVLQPQQAMATEAPTERLSQRLAGATAQLSSADRLPSLTSRVQPVVQPARRSVVRPMDSVADAVRVARAQRPIRATADLKARSAPKHSADGTLLAPRAEEIAVAAEQGQVRTASRPGPLRVQNVDGRVVSKAQVGTGSIVYAAARVEHASSTDEVGGLSRSPRKVQTPLAVRRRRSMRPVGYASASRDFSLLVPEIAAPDARVERARNRASVLTSSAAPSIRIEASGPLSRTDLETVLKSVSGVVRALERAERPRVATPVAQRVAQHQPESRQTFAPSMARSPVSRRVRRRSAGSGETAVPASGASVWQRETLPVTRRIRTISPERGVLAQSAVAEVGEPDQPLPAYRTPRDVSVSSSIAHAEGRATASNTYGVMPSRIPAERVQVQTGAATPSSRAQRAVSSSARRRPNLSQTLGRIARSTAPLGMLGGAAGTLAAVQDDGRAWSQRAETGSGLFNGARPSDESRPNAPRTADGSLLVKPTAGTVLHALARATSAEDVVRVIMERADGLRGIAKELPGPAVELVQRIVRATDEAQVLSANVMAVDELAPLSVHSRAPSADSEEPHSTQSTWNGQRSRPARRSQAGAGQSMRLANKLMQLVHLAENERRLADAQRHVRMAQEGEHASGEDSHAASGESVKAPNMKALQRAVYEAVLREIELSKQRGQGSSNGW